MFCYLLKDNKQNHQEILGNHTLEENIWLELKGKDTNARIPVEDIRQIAKALLHMHDKGLVHGDFGSHNVGNVSEP